MADRHSSAASLLTIDALSDVCDRLVALHAATAEAIGAWSIGRSDLDPAVAATWAALVRDHGREAAAWADRRPAITTGPGRDHDDPARDPSTVAEPVAAALAAAATTSQRLGVLGDHIERTVAEVLGSVRVDPRLDAPTAERLRLAGQAGEHRRALLADVDRHR